VIRNVSVRRAIFGDIAETIIINNKGAEVVGIDSERLLSRLLFFDEVVINSTRLGEIPFLVTMFGREGFEELLRSGLLKLTTEISMIVTDRKQNGVRELPPLEFEQGFAMIQDNPQNLEMNFQNLLKITGLSNSNRENLSDLLKEKLVRLSSSYGNDLLLQVRKDLTTNLPLLKAVLGYKRPELGVTEFQLAVHDLGSGRQRFETNLQSIPHYGRQGARTIGGGHFWGCQSKPTDRADGGVPSHLTVRRCRSPAAIRQTAKHPSSNESAA
jgi:hypothetical protein